MNKLGLGGMVVLTALQSLSGCATLSPEEAAERGRELDEENQRRVMQQELATSPSPRATTPPRPPLCNETRSAGIVKVTCRAYSADKSYTTALMDRMLRMAAESTLAAGKTHFSSLGYEVLQVQTTQPICRQEREQNTLGTLLQGLAQGLGSQNESTTDCSYTGDRAHCTTKNPPPRPVQEPPRYKTACEGGGELQWIDSADTFEVLDAIEAAARNDPLIPLAKRPIEAHAVLTPTNAGRVAPATDPVDPFESEGE
jgi:hypothetical protein